MAKKHGNPTDPLVGNRVRLRRMLIGMSQERLGELLGLTFQQIQKYEKGVNRIGAGRLWDISRILGASITYFFEDAANHTTNARGFSENESSASVMEFVSSNEGLNLAIAFMRIKEPKVKKRVLDLVRSIADGEED